VCWDCRRVAVARAVDRCAGCDAAAEARYQRELDVLAGPDPADRARVQAMLADGLGFPGYIPGRHLAAEHTVEGA